MKENDFIEKLSSELKPVEKLESVSVRFFQWMTVAILCLGAGLSLVGVREDWDVVFRNPLLLAQNISILLGVVSSSVAALALSVPGKASRKTAAMLVALPFSIWVFVLILSFAITPNFSPRIGIGCMTDISVLGLIPALLLFYFVKKGATLFRGFMGFLVLLSAAGLGAWAVQFTCHNDDPAHIIIWHFIPVLVLGGLGLWIGNRIFRRI